MDTDTFVSQPWQLGLLYIRRMERAVNEGQARSPDARSLACELIHQPDNIASVDFVAPE